MTFLDGLRDWQKQRREMPNQLFLRSCKGNVIGEKKLELHKHVIIQNESNKFLLVDRETKQARQINEVLALTYNEEKDFPIVGIKTYLEVENLNH